MTIMIEDLADAFRVDEVGILTAVSWGQVLRVVCQPVFARRGRGLHVVAARAAIVAEPCGVGGQPASALVPTGDSLSSALILANRRSIGDGDLPLILAASTTPCDDFAAFLAHGNELAEAHGQDGLSPVDLFPEFTVGADADIAELTQHAATLRRDGIGVALALATDWQSTALAVSALRPDLVTIDIGCADGLSRLLSVAELRRRGVSVLIHGIADTSDLDNALATGADFLTGDYLASFSPVGAEIEPAPPRLATVCDPDRPALRLVG